MANLAAAMITVIALQHLNIVSALIWNRNIGKTCTTRRVLSENTDQAAKIGTGTYCIYHFFHGLILTLPLQNNLSS